MARILIRNVQELQLLQTQIKTLKAMLPTLEKNAIRDQSVEILDEIKTKMKQENFSNKIIDATFLGKTEKFGTILKQHFISNYVADTGFDVSNAREEGTRDHTVLPKKRGGVLRWMLDTGEVIFRKKSRPKGIERLLIIEKTLKENEITINSDIRRKLAESAQRVLGV